jgi:glycosyltransferase involved in cell wall biosynthesis
VFRPCVVIPVYNHEHAIAVVLDQVLAQGLTCILVDDGSGPECAQVLDRLAFATPQHVILLRHVCNSGKGAAVMTGMRHAYAAGYSHALQVDADGQHNVGDFPAFLALAARYPAAVIAGHPIYDASVPTLRLYARYLTHIWVWINTLSFQIKDSMCGFRVYPLACVVALAAHQKLGSRMNFDTEVLVRLYWDGVQVINLPTRVCYPLDGVSHFRAWLDNVLITRMHTNLFFGMLWRLPRLLSRKWRAR